MYEQVEQFLHYLEDERGYSRNTIAAYRNDLSQFVTLLDETTDGSVESWTEVDQELIQAYSAFLEGESYASSTVARKTAAVKSFFSYLHDRGLVSQDPTATLSAPKVEKRLPRVLSRTEIERLLAEPTKIGTVKALRDRALLELLYATGMRVSEIIALRLDDLDLDQNNIFCANRDERRKRLPLTQRAAEALSTYVHKGRDAFLQDREETMLFVNQRGRPLTRQGLWLIIKSYAEAAELGPRVTPHTIRHSCAAHQLAQGSDLHNVKELLGHANISTTQIYAHLVDGPEEEQDTVE